MEEKYFASGCLLCGKTLVDKNENMSLQCGICGQSFDANVTCEENHYICDGCHSEKGMEAITQIALTTTKTDPVAIAIEMMRSPLVYMHGPEHHYLIVAALFAACHNAGGTGDLPEQLAQAKERSSEVPGGICGMWGACGAGIGVGMALSILTQATPLSEEPWGLANQATAKSLAKIGALGGPRCCKRNVFTALLEGATFIAEHLGVEIQAHEPRCGFFLANEECKKTKCPYYPKG